MSGSRGCGIGVVLLALALGLPSPVSARAGKAVLQTEYVADWRHRGLTSASAVARRICSRARDAGFSSLVRHVVPDGRFVAC